MTTSRGLSLLSGGLDSRLAVCVLRDAGAEVEGVTFATPFFDPSSAQKAAVSLNLKLHIIDFTNDEIALIKNPLHGFGGAMNPCIDCHAKMIMRAGELMRSLRYDFVATGEVVNQRPMSQNKQSLGVVERCSGLAGRLVRPLSAQLLEPTIPEREGKLNRSKLLALQGRRREVQMQLATQYGLKEYPSPAGGCKLTEKGFGRRLKDLLEHEGLDERRLVELLNHARRLRLPDGTSVILGRDQADNALLANHCLPTDTLVFPVSVPGPTALLPVLHSEADLKMAATIVCAWSRHDRYEGKSITVSIRTKNTERKVDIPLPVSREVFETYRIL